MSKSKVEICNMALGNIGISQFLGSFEEKSNEGNVCRIYYDQALNRVLEEIPWNFAKSYADLQDIGSPPAQWLYRYRYPANCLFARAVTPRDMTPVVKDYFDSRIMQFINRQDFEIIEDETNGALAICTNIPEALLTFTKRITNTALFSALFIDALAWSLSRDIASPLSAQPQMAQAAGQAYTVALYKAAAQSLNEGLNTDKPDSEFVTARY